MEFILQKFRDDKIESGEDMGLITVTALSSILSQSR